MKYNNKMNMISGISRPMVFINYQIVISYRGNSKLFKSFNILNEGRILKKYYLPSPIPIDENLCVEKIILDRLMEELSSYPGHKANSSINKPKSKKRVVDDIARKTAAKNLFADLGL